MFQISYLNFFAVYKLQVNMNIEQLNADLINAVGNLKRALQCSSCSKQMKTPVTLWSCNHMFCLLCIQHQTRCPVCDMPAWAQDQTQNRRLKDISFLCNQLEGHLYQANATTKQNEILDHPEASKSSTTKIDSRPNKEVTSVVTKELSRKRKSRKTSIDSSTKLVKSKKAIKQETSTKPDKAQMNNKPNSKSKSTPKITIKRCTPKNSRGETPLHLAAMQGKLEDVNSLLEQKADVNAKDHAGWTPLHEACHLGYLEIAEKLLDAGALIDVPGYENDTPLIDAVSTNKIDMVTFLLQRGANVNLRNSDGKTALDTAQSDAMRQILTEHLTQRCSVDSSVQLVASQLDNVCLFFENGYDSKKVKLMKKLLNASTSSNAAETTHFIVSDCHNLKIKRNLKYLQAMAAGSWILEGKWADKCLEAKKWLSEKNFLIKGAYEDQFMNGPLRSITAKSKFFPRLFDGCHFFLYGNFSSPLPTKAQLIDLLKLTGAQILSREPKHDSDLVQSCRKVPYHASPDTPQYYFTYYIVYDPSQKYLPRSVNLGKVATVSASWVLDCISQFRICHIS